jgi:hypothetical protein
MYRSDGDLSSSISPHLMRYKGDTVKQVISKANGQNTHPGIVTCTYRTLIIGLHKRHKHFRSPCWNTWHKSPLEGHFTAALSLYMSINVLSISFVSLHVNTSIYASHGWKQAISTFPSCSQPQYTEFIAIDTRGLCGYSQWCSGGCPLIPTYFSVVIE